MNHLKKNKGHLALNGLILLALLVGVIGSPTPAEAGLLDDGNITQPTAPASDKGLEATDWYLAGDMNGWDNASDPLNDDRMDGDLFAGDGVSSPDFMMTVAGKFDVIGDVQQVPRLWTVQTFTRMVSLTIEVTVPDFTPGTVYIFGNQPELGDWDPGAVPMTQSEPDTWTITLDFLENIPLSYSFGRGSDETEETELDGNTSVPAKEETVRYGSGRTQSEPYSVANWRDPIVLDHFPADGTSNQPIDAVISVTWNQAMGDGTDFLVVGSDGPISGTFTYYANTYTYVFTPSALLAVGATYTVTAAGQTAAGGDSQLVPVQFNFDTMVPTSVELVTLAEKPTMTDSWWWVSWPWLMVMMTAVSLVGLVWIKRRRRQAVAH